MRMVPVQGMPMLNTTPLATIRVDRAVIIEADDPSEKRWQFTLSPYQAVRITTSDCFLVPSGLTFIHNTVCEVVDSPWVRDLSASLGKIDNTATFMSQAHHYFFPLQDDFAEVVAWEITCERIG